MGKPIWLMIALLLLFFTVGCTGTEVSCPNSLPIDLLQMQAYIQDENLPFQFPLEYQIIFEPQALISTEFAKYGQNTRGPEHHAAEDILQPAGTPVYAMADGKVSFSGRKKGYGWLVIIDHPQANLYSLYGHLSPSRWQIEEGPVQKGELIGYLGDPDENGGSVKNPMRPHLHFGVRVGQRVDYPGMGQWRWQAGWIKPCPQDLGWLQPSIVIASQNIHFGEANKPTAGLISKWGSDIFFSGIYIFGGICMFVFAEKQKRAFVLIATGIMLSGIWWMIFGRRMITSYVIIAMAFLFIMTGIYRLIRMASENPQDMSH